MYFRFCYQTGKVYVQSGERFCKFSRGYTLNFLLEVKIILICIFFIIDFCENLQEYFFVWNQVLIIKNDMNNKNINY